MRKFAILVERRDQAGNARVRYVRVTGVSRAIQAANLAIFAAGGDAEITADVLNAEVSLRIGNALITVREQ